MQNASFNARVNQRVSIPNIPVFLVGEKKSFFGLAKNVSRAGIQVENHIPCMTGEKHMLELTLPKTSITIRCNSSVVWCRSTHQFMEGSYSRGMRFTDINPNTADDVDNWVKSHPDSTKGRFDRLYHALRGKPDA